MGKHLGWQTLIEKHFQQEIRLFFIGSHLYVCRYVCTLQMFWKTIADIHTNRRQMYFHREQHCLKHGGCNLTQTSMEYHHHYSNYNARLTEVDDEVWLLANNSCKHIREMLRNLGSFTINECSSGDVHRWCTSLDVSQDSQSYLNAYSCISIRSLETIGGGSVGLRMQNPHTNIQVLTRLHRLVLIECGVELHVSRTGSPFWMVDEEWPLSTPKEYSRLVLNQDTLHRPIGLIDRASRHAPFKYWWWWCVKSLRLSLSKALQWVLRGSVSD